jgi:hypothetical protein
VWFSSGCLHECFPCHETTFFMSRIIHAFLTHSANLTFRGWKVFAQFPNTDTWGPGSHGVHVTKSTHEKR